MCCLKNGVYKELGLAWRNTLYYELRKSQNTKLYLQYDFSFVKRNTEKTTRDKI